MFQKIIVVMLLAFLGFSCQNSVKNSQNSENAADEQTQGAQANTPDISGSYSLPETKCDLKLTITKENNTFKYNFTGLHLDLEGIAILSTESNTTYVTFDGPIGNTPNKSLSAEYSGKTITIQNYGNASNNYHFFPDCDEKHLEFTKK
jgi:hypothetical protein